MKRIQRIVSYCLSILLLISMLPVEVSAAGNIVMNGVDIGYSSGSYFTKNGKSCKNNYWLTHGEKKYDRCHHNGVCTSTTNEQCNCMRYWPTGKASDCQIDLLSSQCMGFARYCQWKVYGSYATGESKYYTNLTGTLKKADCTAENLKAKLLGCAPATHIRLANSHSISVISTSNNDITFADCNSDGYCKVLTHTKSWESFETYVKKYGSITYAYSRLGVGPQQNYADLGTDFTAPIIYKALWSAEKGAYLIENSYAEGDKPPVRIQKENGKANQLWYFSRQSDGSYMISSCQDGKYLDVRDAGTGTGVVIQTCVASGSDAQKWYLIEKDGGYIIKSKLSGYVLDLVNNNAASGNTLQTWEQNGTSAQIWAIYRGDECKLKGPTLSVSAGTSATKTKFTWNNVYGAREYNLKIWPGEAWVGEPYHIEWGATSGCSVQLPAGTYQAYVDSVHYYEFKPSNVVTFTVKDVAKYTISYNANGGSGAPGSQTKTHGVNLTLSSTKPTRTGYSFQGWATSASATTAKYQPGATYTGNANATLYAVWKANQYTIAYHANGGSGSMSNSTHTYNVTKALTKNAFTRTGYTFAGWATAASGNAIYKDQEPVENLTSRSDRTIDLYAKWTPKVVTIRFNKNDGSGAVASQSFTYGASGNRFGYNTDGTPKWTQSGQFGQWDRTGYTLLGWSFEPSAKTARYKIYNEVVDSWINENSPSVNLYAVWELGCNGDHNTATRNNADPTCTDPGSTGEVYCKDCGTVITKPEDIPALGHSWDDGVETLKPTEESTGIKTYTCGRCGETKEETIPALEHKHQYTAKVTAPTCTEKGFTTYTCKCTDSYIADYVDATGHNEVKGEGKAATCTQPGLTEGSHCSSCNTVIKKQEEIPALGHSWDDGIETLKPTEESTGIKTYTCRRCGETKEETIPALEHSHKYSTEVTAPTCLKQGYTTYTCTCGNSYIDDYVDTLAHNVVADSGKNPSCTEPGLTEGTHCSTCSTVLTKQESIPALGHNWGEGVETVKPTEKSTGIMTYTCGQCGEIKEETIPALEHIHNYASEVTAPTCQSQGYTTYTCSCSNSYVDDYVDALPHNPVADDKKDPTCTETGLTEGSHCSVCGTVLVKQEESPALGHNWDEGVETLKPTEQSTGIKTYTCGQCGKVKEEIIPALDHVHSYTSEVTAPTCLSQGYTTYTCSCTDSYVDDYVDALPHNPVTDDKKDPTCTETGLAEGVHCSICNTVITKQEEISALGHSWDEGIETLKPTEQSTGIMTYTCDRCGATKEDTIPALDHVHSYTSEVTAPTCTEKGYTTYTCSCSNSYIADYVDATGHIEVTNEGKDATCTQGGLTEGLHCSVCETILTKQETTSALGHNWDEGVETVKPTEKSTGIMTYSCNRCGETKEETIPALEHIHNYTSEVTAPTCLSQGYTTYTCSCTDSYVDDYVDALSHNPVVDDKKDSTCTETGLTEGSHCSVCNTVLAKQEEIPALGHNWDEGVETLKPTEQSTGIMTYTCGRCGQIREEIIPALEHVHNYTPEITEPSCLTQGYTTYTCSCKDSYVDDYVDALPHNPVADDKKDPTCTETGMTEGSHCSVCNTVIVKQEEIPALGHDWDEGVETLKPTDLTTGILTYTCGRCDETKEETIPMLEHIHNYTPKVTAPTCSEKGFTTYTCKCTDSYIADYTDALGHNAVADEKKVPTCIQTGLTEGTHCSRCKTALKKQDSIPALGHDWDEGRETVKPTEKTTGIMTYTCNRCSQTKEEDIPVLEHVHNYTSEITAPTCTEKGFTTYTCKCTDSYISDYVEAIGHAYDEGKVTSKPGCETNGVKTFSCKNDKAHTYTESVAATGHIYDEGVVTKTPTCKAEGLKTFTCKHDETHTYTEAIELTDHSFTKFVSDKNATCKKHGTKTAKCDYGCGKTKTVIDKGSKLGHKFEDGKCVRCNLSWWNPETGDTIMTAVIVMLVSGSMILLLLIFRKKRKK